MRWRALYFPVLLAAAVTLAGAAYRHRLEAAPDAFVKRQTVLQSLGASVRPGTNLCFIDRSGDPTAFPQTRFALPTAHLESSLHYSRSRDSLLVAYKAGSNQELTDSLPAGRRILYSACSDGLCFLLLVP